MRGRPGWLEATRLVERPAFDFGFVIDAGFYYGPDDFTEEQWHKLRTPLDQPEAGRLGKYVLASGADPDELVRHYMSLMRVIEDHGKNVNDELEYFWIKPVIYDRDDPTTLLEFLPSDTLNDAEQLLNALTKKSDGLVYSDLYQCWDFRAYAEGGSLFLWEGGWNAPKS